MTIKILNLYAGIGGNRKLWSGDIEVTAIENNPEIAKIYQDFFPNDKVIITDAHQYLLEHYKEFDFIWSSPPCPSHSKARYWGFGRGIYKPIYPDMNLYQEIIFLKHYFKGKWCVENVNGYYKPLIKPQELGRHYFWANFIISKKEIKNNYNIWNDKNNLEKEYGISIKGYKFDKSTDKRVLLRNCVEPGIGLHIFEMAFKKPQLTLFGGMK
jgi:DNA (cytosine-5)-methyltransferase 1